jgi:hypothetical protein
MLPFTLMFHTLLQKNNRPVDKPPGGYILRYDDV